MPFCSVPKGTMTLGVRGLSVGEQRGETQPLCLQVGKLRQWCGVVKPGQNRESWGV